MTRQEEIRAKGFSIRNSAIDADYITSQPRSQAPIDYNQIKIGTKKLDDAVLKLGIYNKINSRIADKKAILKAIANYDLKTMREASDFFYKTSGIYSRILRYMAFMYRYDWFVSTYIRDKNYSNDKAEESFYKCLDYLDNFNAKKNFGEIALHVLRYGAYYGYKVETKKGITLQQLPVNYCRCRFFQGDFPAVEFNMKFFDDFFSDMGQKMRVLKLFPAEFSKGYALYKQGKLVPDFNGDTNGWYLLEPGMAVRFTANGEEYPAFISVIPLLLDLDEAQDLDRKKVMQRLLKIVIQKMPLDKNGELIFDIDEAQQLHNNAVQMLGRAIGVDVLTTFADVDVATLADSGTITGQNDDLSRVERQVYNEAGISQNQFNSNGNLALSNSILNDESTMYNMILQFEQFLNSLIEDFNKKPKKIFFRVQILPTTIYNYERLVKLYKEQTQLGHSKILPQVAMGHSQSSVLANAIFENEVLDLVNVFIPPLMSSVMNSDTISAIGKNKTAVDGEEKSAGRKELADTEKSDKTLKNLEAKS